MSQPYVGEIRMFAGNFPPNGWLFCDGALLPISENEVLFNLIGTTYGGDGQSTFALPDLRGRVPVHMGTGPSGMSYIIGESGGVEQATVTTSLIPVHNHALLASQDPGTQPDGGGRILAASPNIKLYRDLAPTAGLAASSIAPDGGSQPHDNFQPYLCVNFIISLYGIYPTQ